MITGKVTDPAAARAAGERWYSELSAGATGWLSSTAGVTADNEVVVLAAFDSPESAQQNSDRPEQGAWWTEMEKMFDQEPTFGDYDGVMSVREGSSDRAGFVQVMIGQTTNPARSRELTEDFNALGNDFRPEILGGLVAVQDDGRFVQAFYFTSESAARLGEQQEPPAELREAFEEEMRLITGMRFFDLTDPWLYSAR